MSTLNDLIARMCPDGVEHKPLGDVGEFIRGRRITKDDFVESGVGCIHYGEIYTRYGTIAAETFSFVRPELAARLRLARSGDLIIAATGENAEEVCKAVAWLGADEIAIHDDCYLYRHSFDPTYISYLFQSSLFHVQKIRFAAGAKMVRVSGEKLAEIRVPVPPIEVQREVVAILSKMESLEAELQAELVARRRQYAVYRDLLLAHRDGVEWMTLGDVGKVSMCKRVFKSETHVQGDVPFFKIGTFGGLPDAFISRAMFSDYRARYPFPKPGDVLISAAGTIGRSVIYDGEDAYFQDSNIVWIDNPETTVLNKYLFYVYQVVRWETDGGTIRRLYNDNLRRVRFPAPSLGEQKRIVEVLDKFDALVNDLSIGLPAELHARRRQYAHYRDRLLFFDHGPA